MIKQLTVTLSRHSENIQKGLAVTILIVYMLALIHRYR